MKKSTSTIITFALAFFISISINAQTTESSDKKTTETECVDKKEKECTKTNKGFSFFSKKSKSESCCKSESKKTAQKASCDSKAQKASNSNAKQSSCCSKTAKASNRDAAAKVRQAIAKGEITTKEGNARLARLQKNNK